MRPGRGLGLDSEKVDGHALRRAGGDWVAAGGVRTLGTSTEGSWSSRVLVSMFGFPWFSGDVFCSVINFGAFIMLRIGG